MASSECPTAYRETIGPVSWKSIFFAQAIRYALSPLSKCPAHRSRYTLVNSAKMRTGLSVMVRIDRQ